MGNTADLAMVQKTIIDASTKRVSHRGALLKGGAVHRVLYQSILNPTLTGRKKLDKKAAKATGMTASLRILSSKADSNTWESFTRSELKLESVHQESPRSDIFTKRATKPLLNQKHHQKHLTWRTGLMLSAPKSSFQMKVHLAFNLEIKVPESGGRVERHRIHVAWSPVWSFHSQWWFGLPCHLLVLVHCVFWSPVNTAVYQEILEHFILPSADKLYGDADFIFQQDLAPAHTAKGTVVNLVLLKCRKTQKRRPGDFDDTSACFVWICLHFQESLLQKCL